MLNRLIPLRLTLSLRLILSLRMTILVCLTLLVSCQLQADDTLLSDTSTEYDTEFNRHLIHLEDGQNPQSLKGYMQQYTDETGDKGLDQILARYQQGQFSPLPGFLNLGYTRSASWVSFKVRAPDQVKAHYFLWLSPYLLNTVDVYIQTGSDELNPNHYASYLMGDHRPVKEQLYIHSSYLVPLTIKPEQTFRVFIRTQTTSTHVLKGWIHSERTLINNGDHLIWYAAFIAGATILGLISFFQSLRLRSAIQFWYGCYLLSEAAVQIGIQGFLPLLIPDYAHLISDIIAGGGTAVAYFTMSMIVMLIVNTRYEHRLFHGYLITLMLLSCFALLLSPTAWYGQVISIMIPLGIFVMPVSAWLYYRKFSWHNRSQRLFMLFFLICSFGIAIHMLRLSGLIPVNPFTYSAMMLNTMAHILLLNLALSEKLLDAEQKARDAALTSESQAISMAKEMTKELTASKEQLEVALSKEHRALQEQGRFIDMISHEYRTPLAIIRTNLDILDLKLSTENSARNNVQTMFKATDRLQEVFDNQLQRDEALYQITPDKHTLSMQTTLNSILEDAQSLWNGRTITSTYRTEPDIRLHADPGLLKTALFNLLDNAMKYSPQNSQIQCCIDQDSEQSCLVISVSNQVNQADTLQTQNLCDKYVRGSNSSGRSGLGLGLFLVRRIAQEHNGSLTLSIESGVFCARLQLPIQNRHVAL